MNILRLLYHNLMFIYYWRRCNRRAYRDEHEAGRCHDRASWHLHRGEGILRRIAA